MAIGVHKRRPTGRPATPGLGFVVEQQPDATTCGLACLHGMYRYYGEDVALDEVAEDLRMLDAGGTLDVFLANHALQRGYRVTVYTYNLELFDPTWFGLAPRKIQEKLRIQAEKKGGAKFELASRGYEEFLELGGELRFNDLEPALLRSHLNRGTPLITGLSATYLYQQVRDNPVTDQDDDVGGVPTGHFVVLTAYRRSKREVLVADPFKDNPFAVSRYYAVGIHRLVGAIFLGIMTYDANILVIEPKAARAR